MSTMSTLGYVSLTLTPMLHGSDRLFAGQTAKIVTGSFKGMLRIYAVKQRDFKADDLLLEQDLGSAILSIAAGRFSSS